MWCGNTAFKDLKPDLSLMAIDKDMCVYSFMDSSKNGRSCLWNPTIHAFQDWELEVVYSLFKLEYA